MEDFNNYERKNRIIGLTKKNGGGYYKHIPWREKAFIAIVALTVGALIQTVIFKVDHQPPQENQGQILIDCNKCHNRKMAMTRYFEKAGNKHPEAMAVAVLATKKPKLLAAIAVKGEKNTPYTERKGGYKKRHQGAWQVNPKDWGPVPTNPIGQALQAESILAELTDSKPLPKALSWYGGDSTDKYQKRVLAELVRVP